MYQLRFAITLRWNICIYIYSLIQCMWIYLPVMLEVVALLCCLYVSHECGAFAHHSDTSISISRSRPCGRLCPAHAEGGGGLHSRRAEPARAERAFPLDLQNSDGGRTNELAA